MLVNNGDRPSLLAAGNYGNPMTSIVENTPAYQAASKVTERCSNSSAMLVDLFSHTTLTGGAIGHPMRIAQKAVIYDPSCMSCPLVVERGDMVYRRLKNGDEKPIGSVYNGHFYTTIKFTKLYLHVLQCLFLQPFALNAYLADDDLEINHLRSPGPGQTYYETDPMFLEVVSSRNNKLHARFKKFWGLYETPISALECIHLDKVFRDMAENDGLLLPDNWGTPVDYTGHESLKQAIKTHAENVFKATFPGVKI